MVTIKKIHFTKIELIINFRKNHTLHRQELKMSKNEDFDDDIEVEDEYAFEETSSLLERKERANKKMESKRKLEEYLEERDLERELSSW